MKSKQFIHFSLYHSNLKDVTTYLQILLIHLNCKIQLVMIIHLAYKEYFQNASDYRRSTLVSEGRLCQQFISRLRQQIWCRIPSSPQAGKHCFAIQKSNWSYPNTSIYFYQKAIIGIAWTGEQVTTTASNWPKKKQYWEGLSRAASPPALLSWCHLYKHWYSVWLFWNMQQQKIV